MTDQTERGLARALVIGDGSWGTTLALLLCRNGISTTLWSAFPEQTERLREERVNQAFLPGVALPGEMEFTADPHSAAQGAELVLSVVPTQFLREVAERFEDALPGDLPLVSATKGLEIETFQTPSRILLEVLGERPLCVLTGPSHAEEVARGLPASLVAASADAGLAERVQGAFNSDCLRVYTADDITGAELAAALKNVIALAAGIADGLGLGDNAKAALLTRGMVEMARLGQHMGARPQTFFGLAGFGDLVTTCYSAHSRNRAVGEAVGRGERLEDVLRAMNMVAEGVWTTKALFGPEAELRAVSMPIAEQVHAILFEGTDPRDALLSLMRREPTGEMAGFAEERS
ncbi:MAG: NAD(P)H-dependent glycerol-3-phosphate dehydrogenase [Planctomycetota bacterium]|jgi:glycerol-3-phosphate dehydrogenase (NAD(P)+)|nr:NAD(P)H-dependent glycerol-3-phosphate dehydrogenase [Planctomycetota bacterium]MDP6763485.1 NAD(P)H-dependent glycerol-3-phosphate dehydrogenase [Planctomycetota bacterium]MDP6990853.1 NAD(P)H-dependent glycerol-3-phosphate dehydrogenase [Planctomycetota bacterium]